jgi:4-hydroxy-tetrahydrodipicolinate synthase
LKGEGPALVIRRLIEETAGAFRVLNGRGGLELPDNLRAGCVGLIPAPECFDVQVRIYELMRTGRPADETEAERLYREILPLILFLMQSIETFLCYGKRVTARRLGLSEVHDRPPAQPPTPFGLASAERYARHLPPTYKV